MSDPESILYVDDEATNLTVFEAAFEDEFDVHVAGSGAAALELMEKKRFPILITDMRMPGMSGVELLERVIPRHPDTVRMILTGFADITSLVEAINSGRIYQYVTKPWDERDLRQVMERAFAHHRSKRRERDLLAELDRQEKAEARLRRLFQRYVPPAVIEEMLGDSAAAAAVGEARDVTLLFSDIRGFTPLCSGREPERILRFANAYFEVMEPVIEAHGGTAVHFLGDGLMAMFGAPSRLEDPEQRAVRAGLAMVAAVDGFNRGPGADLLGEPISIGVGIHRGPVVAGNIGSPTRMCYAPIGDAVHETWAIEGATKPWPNGVLVSEPVRQRLGDRFFTTPAGEILLGETSCALHLVRSGPDGGPGS